MGYFEPERRITKESKIAVLCGGFSSEREISLRSGQNCLQALNNLGYTNSYLIDVDKNIAEVLIAEKFSLAYISLHGKYGEDGAIQGLLEILGLPYTGSKIMASAIAMDKIMTKNILEINGLPIIRSVELIKPYLFPDVLQTLDKANITYPVMVKPATEGSSIGMNKAESESQLEEYLEIAFRHCPKIMIEQFIEGTDLTVGVLELNSSTILATAILELRSKTGWYDYTAKYTAGLTEFILPAEIDETIAETVKQFAIKAHQSIGCRGVSRVDFVLNDVHDPYILEINTIPGMTDLSDLPAQAKVLGVEYDELVDIILHSSML